MSNIKLAISNIAWAAENDNFIYEAMEKYGFTGLEIAPTRIFPENPYEDLDRVKLWADNIHNSFATPSIQSIWFGHSEKIYGTNEERQILLDYSKKAIDFAETIGCKNLVFGCPRNRNLPDGADDTIALIFFKEIADYAAMHNTVIGMEANPPIYNTNFLNTTEEAIDFIKKVNSSGMKLNLDLGTMICNDEPVALLDGNIGIINHVHISEPGLKKIEKRSLHNEVIELLRNNGYEGYVSIEMGRQDCVEDVISVLQYISELI